MGETAKPSPVAKGKNKKSVKYGRTPGWGRRTHQIQYLGTGEYTSILVKYFDKAADWCAGELSVLLYILFVSVALYLDGVVHNCITLPVDPRYLRTIS